MQLVPLLHAAAAVPCISLCLLDGIADALSEVEGDVQMLLVCVRHSSSAWLLTEGHKQYKCLPSCPPAVSTAGADAVCQPGRRHQVHC
jgi:hypothetical protein